VGCDLKRRFSYLPSLFTKRRDRFRLRAYQQLVGARTMPRSRINDGSRMFSVVNKKSLILRVRGPDLAASCHNFEARIYFRLNCSCLIVRVLFTFMANKSCFP